MTAGHKLLLKLTNGQRKKFILNIIRLYGNQKAKHILERKYQSAHGFIMNSFVWSESAEGILYWTNAYQNVV